MILREVGRPSRREEFKSNHHWYNKHRYWHLEVDYDVDLSIEY